MKQKNFAKLKYNLNIPDLLKSQKDSFLEFLQKDIPPDKRKPHYLQGVFLDVFGDASKGEGLTSSDGNLILQFLHYSIGEPKYDIEEVKIRNQSYTAPLKGTFRLLQKLPSGKIKEFPEQDVYLCDIPLMNDTGSFIINGAERVIVTQIHRSPGSIFEEDEEKLVSQIGKKLYKAAIIPYRGSWIEFEFDLNNVLYVHIDKKRKIPATVLLRAIGIETDEQILKLFYEIETVENKDFSKHIGKIIAEDVIDKTTGEIILETLQEINTDNLKILTQKAEKIKIVKIAPELNNIAIILTLKVDFTKTKKEACNLIYKILRTSDFLVGEIAEAYFNNLFFKTRKYDLTKVGRYKINKKLKFIFEKLVENKEFKFEFPSDRKRTLTPEDIIATIKYLLDLNDGIAQKTDDIDHLGNRRIRSVGEFLENQFRIGLYMSARFTRDRMNTADKNSVLTPRNLINITPLVIAIHKFFATSQLSQFLDQTNPLAELTHKRRFSALGPGGLHRKRAGFEVRDVHYTHYGRICPIETPEGPNIGLIVSMACFANVNEYGLLETPYRKVIDGKITDKVEYLTADREDEYVIAQANSLIDENNRILGPLVQCRYRGDIKYVEPKNINYIDVSPLQMVSVSSGLIPFLEHDDANRALMGSNMQRQAVPLLVPEKPIIATGLEKKVAIDSRAVITAKQDGEVIFVSADEVGVYNDSGEIDIYYLKKYERTNQNTCITHIPKVNKGDRVNKGDLIADNFSTEDGQLALGKNLLIAFMSWEGYNFEDAILVSERLIREDIFTSVHIEEFQVEARDTKLGPEEITKDVPNVGPDDLLNLDENGIIRIGSEVKPGDILVGKTAPKGEQQVTMEERLLKAIFGKKAEEVIDASLRVGPGIRGKVIDVKVFTRREKVNKSVEKQKIEQIRTKYKQYFNELKKECEEAVSQADTKIKKEKIIKFYEYKEKELKKRQQKEEEITKYGEDLPITVNKVVKVYIATKRVLQIGDKLAGRHGNKGCIAKILPVEDMPYLPDGTPVDVVLSPLSVPSRMNVGQILEAMLGWAASVLNIQMICPVFDSASEQEIIDMVRQAKDYLKSKGVLEKYLPTDNCSITLYDGRTGEPFMEKVTIGNMYLMKLVHLVEEKIHARSTGPYSLITRQPLGGKAQFGGQRIGEMEVWAIEGYGAAHILQEFLTIKSDDTIGRTKIYESIIKGEPLTQPGIPESFKVLVRELQGVCLDIQLLSSEKEPPSEQKKVKEVKKEFIKITKEPVTVK